MRSRTEIDSVHITIPHFWILFGRFCCPLCFFFLGIGHVGEFFTMNMSLPIASAHHSKRSVAYPLTAVRIIKTVLRCAMNSAVVLRGGIADYVAVVCYLLGCGESAQCG